VQSGNENLLQRNTALGTGIWDLNDTTCTNTWKKNVFVTSSGSCIE
jgi:hypothetical protein